MSKFSLLLCKIKFHDLTPCSARILFGSGEHREKPRYVSTRNGWTMDLSLTLLHSPTKVSTHFASRIRQRLAFIRIPHRVFDTMFEKKDKIVLVMDYAQGGELYDYLNKMGRLSEWEARRIFRQIVSAIHSCHQNGIVHRDLKLENIILDDEGNVKIADFGLANYYSHSSMLTTFCGSPLYASPEIVNGRSYYGPEELSLQAAALCVHRNQKLVSRFSG
ncbi:hypothetical protein RRG08_049176 [Elysia crispata]|uniref:Protein kinase domain-containing protein n=1 Tax=Elysia crispata TaxID=231223 RepID=A0AAE1ATG8_9GAST|nr:hypothetical protein RRG08_049176 [Elysia crispata]